MSNVYVFCRTTTYLRYFSLDNKLRHYLVQSHPGTHTHTYAHTLTHTVTHTHTHTHAHMHTHAHTLTHTHAHTHTHTHTLTHTVTYTHTPTHTHAHTHTHTNTHTVCAYYSVQVLVKILCVKLVDCLLFSHFMCCKAIIIIFYISSDISRVEPNVGSAEGGTLITIT